MYRLPTVPQFRAGRQHVPGVGRVHFRQSRFGFEYLVDGSNVQIPVYGQATQLQARASVQEVRVESANMSPEFGNGVAAVNVITKSGSNSFHGELFEYLRNSAVDANLYFNNQAGRTIQPYAQNQFGGAVGGPALKNKLLFFANYEGFRVSSASSYLPRCRTRTCGKATSRNTSRRGRAEHSCRRLSFTTHTMPTRPLACAGHSRATRFARTDFAVCGSDHADYLNNY